MSLKNNVVVNTHYTRSINLERDANSIEVVKAYIPTSRALRTFSKIADTFHQDQAPRAWSLVGPYGSGKSSFSVFLSQLLSKPNDAAAKAAQNVLNDADKTIVKPFKKAVKGNQGYFKILITGAPEPMSLRLVRGMAEAAEKYWADLKNDEGKKIKKPALIKKLWLVAESEQVVTTEVVDLFKALQAQLEKVNCAGILLIIDELGKFLEYEARHYGANDIYLLQALAEHACEGNKVNLFIFALLHQSFEQYAKGLGESLKNEWSKVQGRFEEVPFLENAEQVLRVVSAAFEHNFSKAQQKNISASVDKTITTLEGLQALPGALTHREATTLFESCYPLHPVSAVLLPLLCQKVAQNERTLFSYLGSHEEFGLQDMLNKLESEASYVYPHHIYDYFITNQPAVIGDHLTHRRWAEVVTAIERLGDVKQDELNLLKTIGILNIVGSKGGFKASEALLETCMPNKSIFTKASKTLKDQSVITYRRYNSEFRVWQGSDFDLELALQEELNNLGNFSLADELNTAKSLLPVVARRYTIKSGGLRYFVPTFVDAKNYKTTAVQSEDPRIIFYLAAGQDDEKSFRDKVVNHFSDLDFVVLCLSGMQLREAVAETQALHRVQTNRQELNADPIAKREFEDRLTAAEQAESAMLQGLLESPKTSLWFNSGENQNVKTKRGLQEAMSFVLQKVYSNAPVIRNELINRDKPSSQATAARNKLLYAMLNHESEEDLGIEKTKFPPEKAIYRSLLQATGLHKQNRKGVLAFLAPEADKRILKKKENELEQTASIAPVWARINEFLDSTERQAKSFVELNNELMAPPYGVKAGTLPILYIASYMTYRHELAFYEGNRYLPKFTEEKLERFVKRPDEFKIQRFRIKGLNTSIYDQYQKALFSNKQQRTVIQLVKPIAEFIGELPRYTQKTESNMSKSALAMRSAFHLSTSPEKLLFIDLPKALGFEGKKTKDLEGFSDTLQSALRDLKYAYPNMIARQQKMLATAMGQDETASLPELRNKLSWYSTLENFTIERDGLKAFIRRISSEKGDDKQWLEDILSFLGQLPTAQWTDITCGEAEFKLADYSRRILDLQKLYIEHEVQIKDSKQDVDILLLKSLKLGHETQERLTTLTEKQRILIAPIKFEIEKSLKLITDKDLRLAALADFVDYYMNKVSVAESKNTKRKRLKHVN